MIKTEYKYLTKEDCIYLIETGKNSHRQLYNKLDKAYGNDVFPIIKDMNHLQQEMNKIYLRLSELEEINGH